MVGRADWIMFLNEAATWETRELAEGFFSAVAGHELRLDEFNAKEVSLVEAYLREQLNLLHFKGVLNFDYLNERLGRMALRLVYPEGNQSHDALPQFRAVSTSGWLSVADILDTFLLQFAAYLSDTAGGARVNEVFRCEGLCSKDSVLDCRTYYERFQTLEESWKNEVLENTGIERPIERCSDYFVANPGAKFCSDSCRFSTFALRKKMQAPEYQAAKQKRYRERKKLNKN